MKRFQKSFLSVVYMVFLYSSFLTAVNAQIALGQLVLTDSINVTLSGSTFNRRTSQQSFTATLTNNGTEAVQGPIFLGIDAITSPDVSAANNDEVSTAGIPVYTVNVHSLAPGTSVSVGLVFNNSTRVRFSFTSLVFIEPSADTTPPVMEITSPTNNAEVNQSPVTVNGTISDESTVTVTVNGINATISNGSYSASIPLVTGSNTLTAIATDAAGNTASTSIQVTLLPPPDISPPVIGITSPADDAVVDQSPLTVTGTVSDESTVTVAINGINATVSNGNYSVSVSLQEGLNTLTATATDAAGNTASTSIQVTLQQPPADTPPIIEITSPVSLQTFGTSPITVSGIVSTPDATLLVNREIVTNDNGTFSALVTLEEGFNAISVIARLNGLESVDSITAALDLTPPIITVESHENNQTVHSDKVTITGLVNDTVRGTVSEGEAVVLVNGINAEVSNRSYAAMDVPLVEGNNVINIIATDRVGNVASTELVLNREVLTGKYLEIVGGQNQIAEIKTVLSSSLKVRVLDKNDVSQPGTKVIFRVTQGDGVVEPGTEKEGRAAIITADANGEALTNFKVGSRVGTANQKVRASVVGLEGETIFTASAKGNLGVNLSVNTGNNQRGAVGQRLPQPLVTYVSDTGSNPVANARVSFEVVTGSGEFSNGLQAIEVLSSKDGFAAADFKLGSEQGLDAQRVVATLIDTSASVAPTAGFNASAFVPAAPADTELSGVVLDNQDNPLEGVTLRIEDTSVSGITNADGQFLLDRVPVGPVHLLVDGSTVTNNTGEYPTLSFNPVMVAGINNTLPQPIYMVRLTDTNVAQVSLAQSAVLTMQDFPDWKMEIAGGSATFPDGSKEGVVSVTAVNANKVPMVPPNGLQPQLVVTIQPSGTLFDPPAKITVPNVDGLLPGQQADIYSYDHDLEEFVSIGLGTVSEDGSVITSNPGVGILKAGWFAAPRPIPPSGDGPTGGPDCPAGQSCSEDPNEPPPEDEKCGFFDVGCQLDKVKDAIDDIIDDVTSCDPGEICDYIADSAQDAAEAIGDAIDAAGEKISDLAEKVADGVEDLINDTTELAKDTFDTVVDAIPDEIKDLAQRAADPIVMATGELEFTQIDLKIPGRGFDFELKRTYRSRIHFDGRLGYNWVFNYHEMLVIPGAGDANQNIQRSMPNGLQYIYIKNIDGSYQSPESLFEVLSKNVDNTYTIRKPNGFKINFNIVGHMVSQQDRYGNTMEFEYDSDERLVKVIDTLGREIVFTYRSDSGHIDTVTDFMGRSVRYYYDENRNLKAARTPIVTGTPNGNDFANGKFTQYTYSSGFDESSNPELRHANHNLLTVTDAFGFLYLRNVYVNDPNSYEFDKIVEQQFGESTQKFQLNYQQLIPSGTNITVNTPVNKTTVIDRNGNRIEYLHGEGGMLVEQRVYTNRDINPDDPEVFVTSNTYNQDGLLLTTTKPEGDSNSYVYDVNNPLRYMQRNMLSSTATPGSRGAVQSELTESFSYEPIYNQLRSLTNSRGFTTTHTFDYQHAGNLVALATELNSSETEVSDLLTSFGISLSGGVSGQIGGNIVRVDLPTATIADGSSQPVFKTRSYNRFGQMIEEVDAEGIVTQFEYYGENEPDGDGLNSSSSRTLATDTGGYRKAVIRDARIDTRRNRAGPALSIRTETVYDAVGNKVTVTDGRGNTTRFIRNQLNQVIRKIDSVPFEYMTDFYYDANNNLVRTSQQNIGTTGPNLSGWVHTIYNYNALNDKTREIKIPQAGVYLETHYEYDANQNIIAIQQPEGNRIERVYDERDLVYQSTRGAGTPEASTQTMHYDGNANLVRTIDAVDTDGNGNPDTTLMTYDGYNRLIQSTDAEGNRMTYQYDPNNNKVLERHFGNSGIAGIDNQILLAETVVQFDQLDRPFQRDDSLLVNGQPQNVGSGLTPNDNKVTGVNYYDANGLVVRSIDDNGNESLSSYDGLNRRLRVTDANGNITETAYDNNNNVTQVAVTQVNVEGRVANKVISSSATYDALNRKTTSTDRLGNTSTYRYDSRHNVVKTTDALGNIVLNFHDGINRLVETRQYLSTGGTGEGIIDQSNPTNPDGYNSTFFAYDANSRLVFQGDDKQNATTYVYDALNRKTTYNYADGTRMVYGYDKDHNIATETDQNGSVFTHSYDALNRRVSSQVVPAQDVIGSTEWIYSYDGLSRRISAKDNNDPSLTSDDSVVEYRYNSLNYLLSESNNGLVTTALHDGLGNRQQISYASGRRLNYSYDNIYNIKAINEANAIGETTAAPSIVEYDYASRRVLERRYGNGTKLSYIEGVGEAANDSGYDGINRVLQHRHTYGANALIAGFDYKYDAVHNRRYEVDQFAQLADVYEYDSAYRVIRAAYRVPANDANLQAVTNNSNTNADVAGIISPQDESYLLDGVGNWASVQTVNGNQSDAVGYQLNDMNEYTRIGAVEQSHDDNGNLTSDGERNYHYDARNRLVRVSTLGGNTIATYKYDAFGRRIEKRAGSETVRYVHFGKRVLEERNAFNQVQRSYVYGRSVDEVLQLKTAANDSFYYHDNSIGSIAALTDESGGVIERYRYNAYGETTILAADGVTELAKSSAGNSYGFTGRRFDGETGFYYYRARYYAPERGRFIQRDPLGYSDGMGVYAYAGNNPVNFVDPEGLLAKPAIEWADDVNLLTRVGGLLGAIGGAAEVGLAGTLGAAGVAACSTGVGCVAGGAAILGAGTLGAHGLDHIYSGLATALSGENKKSLTAQGLEKLGLSEGQAAFADATIGIVGSVAAGVATKGLNAAVAAKSAKSANSEKFYRYVGEGEAQAIRNSGKIPNVDAAGNPKDVYITDRLYKTAGRAKTHNQLPSKPSYRVEIDPGNVPNRTPFTKVKPGDNPNWGIGGGVEATTKEAISVDPTTLTRLKGG